MKCAVILVAAGKSTRFQSKTPKIFTILRKKPLIDHSLTVFEACIKIDTIVIVAHPDYLAKMAPLAKRYKKVSAIVPGGKMRADSVKCGLAALPKNIDYVLVHDAARPFVDAAMLSRMVTAFKTSDAVITAVPAKATIKEVDPKRMTVKSTLQRSLLWEVQTPQGFKRQTLEKAHAKKFSGEATDDAMMVERLGIKVKVIMGDYRNIKVTTPEDLKIAIALSSS